MNQGKGPKFMAILKKTKTKKAKIIVNENFIEGLKK